MIDSYHCYGLIYTGEKDVAPIVAHGGGWNVGGRFKELTHGAGAFIAENGQGYDVDHLPVGGEMIESQAQEQQVEVGVTGKDSFVEFGELEPAHMQFLLPAVDIRWIGDDVEEAFGIVIQFGFDRECFINDALAQIVGDLHT